MDPEADTNLVALVFSSQPAWRSFLLYHLLSKTIILDKSKTHSLQSAICSVYDFLSLIF